MSDRLKDVARAILAETETDKGHAHAWDAALALARAAIESIREPTPEMIAAVGRLGMPGDPIRTDEAWRAKIDSILNPLQT